MHRAAGWSLIETLIAIAIVGVLAALAAPALGHALARQQALAAGNDFLGALHHARSAAIGSGARAILCPSADGLRCMPGTRWDGGWLLALDRDHDDQPDAAPLLRAAAAPQLRIVSSRGRRVLRFRADGSAAGSNATITVCHRGRAETTRLLVMSNSGRVRAARADAANAAACAAL